MATKLDFIGRLWISKFFDSLLALSFLTLSSKNLGINLLWSGSAVHVPSYRSECQGKVPVPAAEETPEQRGSGWSSQAN